MNDMLSCKVKPYEGQEKYIFISYCHKDRVFVYPLVEQLAKDGYRVWYDEGINPGSEWPEIIASHLYNSAICVAIVSNNSQNSHNCRREITFALLKKKPFISVFLEPVELTPGVEMQLSANQSVFKYKYGNENEFFLKLYENEVFAACRGIVPSGNPTGGPEAPVMPDLEQLRKEAEEAEQRLQKVREKKEEIAQSVAEQERIREEVEVQVARLRQVLKETEDQTGRLKQALVETENEEKRLHLEAEEAACRLKEAESRIPPAKGPQDPDGGGGPTVPDPSGPDDPPTILTGEKQPDYQLVRMSTGEVVNITERIFVIGRSSARADYIIPDDRTVGRVHAIIVNSENGYEITDNHSLNKTFINGKELEPNVPYSLKEGDVIQISMEKFLFRRAAR